MAGKSWTVALLSAALAVLAGPAAGQEDAGAAFFDTVDVEVVNVEVFVTDKKGDPIAGLTREDFELRVDGEPVEITNLYQGRSLAGAGAGPVGAIPEAAAAAGSAAPEAPPEEQRLTLAVFVDNANIRPPTRNRVLAAVRASLFEHWSEADQVLLASYHGSLQVRHGLTSDPEELVAAIEELATTSSSGGNAALDRRGILADLMRGEGDPMTDWTDIYFSIQAYAARRFQDTERAIEAMAGLVDLLSGLPGRKALLYVSDGMALRPGEALFYAWERVSRSAQRSVNSEARTLDATQLFEKLGRHANASRITFYPILAAGAQSQTETMAEQSILGPPILDRGLQAIEQGNLRGSMRILAEATGGRPTLNTRAVASALDRVRGDFESYYSLGFAPVGTGDGKDHKIVVKVKDKSLKVRHRESYRVQSAGEYMTARTRTALELGVGANPLGVAVGFGEKTRDEKGRFLVPMLVKVPFAELLLVPGEGVHDGRITIYVGTRDSRGRTSPIQTVRKTVRVPDDRLRAALAGVAGYPVTLLMREGEHQVVVGVRDELAGVESVVRYGYDPAEAAPDG